MPMQKARKGDVGDGRSICIFCEKWESGGIESLITNLLTHMDLSGMQIHIVVAELAPSIFTAPLEALGITFFELSGSQKRLLQNRKLFQMQLERFHYDVIHLNVFQALSMQYMRIAETYHINNRIVHSHNTALRKSSTRSIKLIVHHLAKHMYARYATRYLACSKAAANFMFPAKTVYQFIPNGIDVERFYFRSELRTAMRKNLGVDDDCLLVGSVGRLCYQKNQMFLVEMMAGLLKKRSNVKFKLLLVGEGEMRQALERRVSDLEITEDVIFYGTTNETPAMYSAMDLLAFPSLFEGLGIAAIEAQTNGLPVLCSEYIPAEARITNLAVTLPLRMESWVTAVCQCAGHRELSPQEKLRCVQFDIHAVAEQMRTIFKE